MNALFFIVGMVFGFALAILIGMYRFKSKQDTPPVYDPNKEEWEQQQKGYKD
jgi:hypothetical protein